jgi:hypothetical protein
MRVIIEFDNRTTVVKDVNSKHWLIELVKDGDLTRQEAREVEIIMNMHSTMSARQPIPDKPKEGPGFAHDLTCNSAWASGQYDTSCLRCKKIKAVVMLRRKNIRQGAAPQEFLAAKAMADRIIAEFALTRGEVYDREFPEAQLPERSLGMGTVRQRKKDII